MEVFPMKRGYKSLLSVLGAVVLALPFAGCEIDAQEAVQAQSGATNSVGAAAANTTGTNAAAGASSTNITAATSATLSTPEPASANVATGTNLTSTTADTNAVVVLNRIPPAIPANV